MSRWFVRLASFMDVNEPLRCEKFWVYRLLLSLKVDSFLNMWWCARLKRWLNTVDDLTEISRKCKPRIGASTKHEFDLITGKHGNLVDEIVAVCLWNDVIFAGFVKCPVVHRELKKLCRCEHWKVRIVVTMFVSEFLGWCADSLVVERLCKILM